MELPQRKKVLDLVRTCLEAHNGHNVDRVSPLLSEGIRFETVAVWVKHGRDKLRELEERDAALG